jgi:hypothetical protein
MKRLLVLVTIAIIATCLFAGCASEKGTGILQGYVTIGPLSPVETPGVTPPVPSEVYAARKIMVYDKNGVKLIKQVDIIDGRYYVKLEPGIYTVDINHIGVDSSSDVPRQVEIKEGITFRLDIDIDTGIR